MAQIAQVGRMQLVDRDNFAPRGALCTLPDGGVYWYALRHDDPLAEWVVLYTSPRGTMTWYWGPLRDWHSGHDPVLLELCRATMEETANAG